MPVERISHLRHRVQIIASPFGCEELAETALLMASLPPHVNMLEAIVLPVEQLYLGRG